MHFHLWMWRHPCVRRWMCICPFHGSFHPGNLGIKYLTTSKPCTQRNLKWQISCFYLLVLGGCSEAENKLSREGHQETLFFAAFITMNPKDFLLCCKMEPVFEALLWKLLATTEMSCVSEGTSISSDNLFKDWKKLRLNFGSPSWEGLPGYKAVLANTPFWQETVFFLVPSSEVFFHPSWCSVIFLM